MRIFHCSYLDGDVELTDERLFHIKQRHPDVEIFISKIRDVLLVPELIRQKNDVLLFSLFIDEIKKYFVVVIKSELRRNFILTCYLTSKIKGGEVVWIKRD